MKECACFIKTMTITVPQSLSSHRCLQVVCSGGYNKLRSIYRVFYQEYHFGNLSKVERKLFFTFPKAIQSQQIHQRMG